MTNVLSDKRLLVTAGNTAMPIDSVRVLTNIFTGRTGEDIAKCAAKRGWRVTLLTSSDRPIDRNEYQTLDCRRYRTFDDLAQLMETEITGGAHDAIVHSAAVSDFYVTATHVMQDGALRELAAAGPAAGKISSKHESLFLELKPAPKLVDRIREPWGFKGKLVKFKLQVGLSDTELVSIARKSMLDSNADYMVANCLEWSKHYAFILGCDDIGYSTYLREELADQLLDRLEQ